MTTGIEDESKVIGARIGISAMLVLTVMGDQDGDKVSRVGEGDLGMATVEGVALVKSQLRLSMIKGSEGEALR